MKNMGLETKMMRFITLKNAIKYELLKAPWNFFPFPRMIDDLGGFRFQSTKEMKKALENFMKGLLFLQDWE